ncbi:MAG: hypothetical protein ACRD50_07595 [Candidatus Acidiferrales bacterium]
MENAILFPTTPQRRNSVLKPILITVGGGFLLAIGSCFGALTTASVNGLMVVSVAFGVLFVVGMVCFLGGIFCLLVCIIWLGLRSLVNLFSGTKAA